MIQDSSAIVYVLAGQISFDMSTLSVTPRDGRQHNEQWCSDRCSSRTLNFLEAAFFSLTESNIKTENYGARSSCVLSAPTVAIVSVLPLISVSVVCVSGIFSNDDGKAGRREHHKVVG